MRDFQDLFHLLEVPLPGGDSSIKQPARIGVSYLHEAGIEMDSDLPPVNFFTNLELKTLNAQIEKRINTPLTSSMGRLFDAVASIIGIRQQVSYEAQAAIDLEYFSDPNIADSYDFEIKNEVINTVPIIQSIVKDWRLKVNKSIISAKFHNTIARVCIEACKNIRTRKWNFNGSLIRWCMAKHYTLGKNQIPIGKRKFFSVDPSASSNQ